MREKLSARVSSVGKHWPPARVLSASEGSSPGSGWASRRIALVAMAVVLTLPAMLWARHLRTEWIAGGPTNNTLSLVLVLWIGCGVSTLIAAILAPTAKRLYGWVDESFPDIVFTPWLLIGAPVVLLCLGLSGILFAQQPTRWHGAASQVGLKRRVSYERQAVPSIVSDADAEMIYRQFKGTNPELSGPDDVRRKIEAVVDASHRR